MPVASRATEAVTVPVAQRSTEPNSAQTAASPLGVGMRRAERGARSWTNAIVKCGGARAESARDHYVADALVRPTPAG
jgi:hypothetical protein